MLSIGPRSLDDFLFQQFNSSFTPGAAPTAQSSGKPTEMTHQSFLEAFPSSLTTRPLQNTFPEELAQESGGNGAPAAGLRAAPAGHTPPLEGGEGFHAHVKARNTRRHGQPGRAAVTESPPSSSKECSRRKSLPSAHSQGHLWLHPGRRAFTPVEPLAGHPGGLKLHVYFAKGRAVSLPGLTQDHK